MTLTTTLGPEAPGQNPSQNKPKFKQHSMPLKAAHTVTPNSTLDVHDADLVCHCSHHLSPFVTCYPAAFIGCTQQPLSMPLITCIAVVLAHAPNLCCCCRAHKHFLTVHPALTCLFFALASDLTAPHSSAAALKMGEASTSAPSATRRRSSPSTHAERSL